MIAALAAPPVPNTATVFLYRGKSCGIAFIKPFASVLYPLSAFVSGSIVTVFIALTTLAEASTSSKNSVTGSFNGIVTLKPLYPLLLLLYRLKVE